MGMPQTWTFVEENAFNLFWKLASVGTTQQQWKPSWEGDQHLCVAGSLQGDIADPLTNNEHFCLRNWKLFEDVTLNI